MAKLEDYSKFVKETSLEEFLKKLSTIKNLNSFPKVVSKTKSSATYKSNKDKQIEDLFKKLSPEQKKKVEELLKEKLQ